MYFALTDRDQRATLKTAWLTIVLIGINAVVYLGTALILDETNVFYTLGFLPISWRPLTLISHMFVHANILHILGNMGFLWWAGRYVEDVIGKVFYLASYLLGGLCAVGLHLALNTDPMQSLVGASGAISGILGLYMVFFPRIKMNVRVHILFVKVKTFKTRALWAVVIWFVYQLLMALISLVYELPIAFWAHIGGFIGGLLIGLSFVRLGKLAEYQRRCDARPEPPPSEAAIESGVNRNGLAVLAVVALLVIELVVPYFKLDLTLRYLVAPRPVEVGTLIPQPLSTISPKRIYAVRPLAVWDSDKLGCYYGFAFSPDGRFLACGGRGHVQLVHTVSGDRARALPIQDKVQSIRFTPEGYLLTVGEQVWAWPTRDGQDIEPYLIECQGCQDADSIALTPDGRVLASTTEGRPGVQIWQTAQREPATLLGERKTEKFALSPDGTRLALRYQVRNRPTGLYDTYVEVWNVQQGQLESSFAVGRDPGPFDEMVFSPNARLLAVVAGSASLVEMWQVADGQMAYTLEIEDEPLSMFGQVAFSPSGELVVTTQETRDPRSIALQAWRASDGKPLYRLPWPSEYRDLDFMRHMTFSPDGRLLVTISSAVSSNTIILTLWGVPEQRGGIGSARE